MAKQKSASVSRRKFLEMAAVAGVAGAAAACPAPTAAPPVEVTKLVEKEVTKLVEKPVEVTKEVTKVVEKAVEVTRIVEKDPRVGGVLKASYNAAPPSLDTMSTTAASCQIVTIPILEQLVARSETYEPTPMLAESWEISPDSKTYTFHLRQGVKFHNGKELTSDDVIASFKRYLEVSPRKAEYDLLDSYTAKDKSTVVMTLKKGSIAFLESLIQSHSPAVVMPKEIIEGKKANELKPEDIIGTGPYKLADFKPDQLVTVKRYADYKSLTTDRSGLGGAKTAFFDELQYIPAPEAGARVAAIEAGQADWIRPVPVSDVERLSANPKLTSLKQLPFEWKVMCPFNHVEKWTSDVNFRQAVAAVLDADAIGLTAANGNKAFYRTNGSLYDPTTIWYYGDDPVAAATYNQKNPAKAKELLAKAGYNGEEIVMTTTKDYSAFYAASLGLSEQLKAAGVNVKLVVRDWPALIASWKELKGWNITVTAFGPAVPSVYQQTFDSRSPYEWRGSYANPDLDKLFDAQKTALTIEERQQVFKKIQQIFYQTLPYLNVVETFGVEVIQANLKGYQTWPSPRFWGCWRQK